MEPTLEALNLLKKKALTVAATHYRLEMTGNALKVQLRS